MNKLALALVTCLAVGASVVLAGRAESVAGDPIAELIELSGIDKSIEQVPALLAAELEQQKSELDEEAAGKVAAAMREAFDPKTLYQTVHAHLSKNFDREHVASNLAFLRAPLARKMTEFEVESNSPESVRALPAFAESLQAAPPPPERLVLIDRLERASAATQFQLELLKARSRIVSESLAKLVPIERQTPPEQLESQLDQMEQNLGPRLREEMLVTFLYTYRKASDEELEEYVRFHERESGRELVGALSEALLTALQGATEQAYGKLAELMKSRAGAAAPSEAATGAATSVK